MVALLSFLIEAFASIFTIVNPFSAASVFLGLTSELHHPERKRIARKSAIAAGAILLVFTFAGAAILSFFSITIAAFRIAGGLLIAVVGFQMIGSTRQRFSEDHKREAREREDISIVPIAMPLLAGPGAITAVLVLSAEATNPFNTAEIAVAILAVAVASFIVLAESDRVVSWLGETGKDVVEKVMGLIVMVIGTQFVINGVHALLSSWGVL